MDGLSLLEEHAAGFEVADFGEHAALHYGAAFVVFDVSHPTGFGEGDFFGEALFFEVADCVVVGVGKEVHYVGSAADVILVCFVRLGKALSRCRVRTFR